MRWYDGRTILLTGASGGIGAEMARLLAEREVTLLLVARSEDLLESVAAECRASGARAEVIVHDLAVPGAAAALYDRVTAAGHTVDVLVNNAGFGISGPFTECSAGLYEKMLTLNVTNLVALTRLFLPGMIERGSGGVLNIASMSGFLPMPHLAVYAASKAFVKQFSQAVHAEMRGTGVHVTCSAPGATESGFFDRAKLKHSVGRLPLLGTRRVARVSLKALARNTRVRPVSVLDRAVAVGSLVTPDSISMFLSRRAVDVAR